MSMKPDVTPVKIDVISDIVCPWCWLGTRYLHQAIQHSGKNVELIWRPHMLDATLPEGGLPYKDYMKRKFGAGPNDRFKAMREHLEMAAPDAGICFKLEQIPMRPNTLNAHRLMKWAQGQGRGQGDLMAEALFKGFFDDLVDIGDKAVLTEIARTLGLDADIISDLLAGEQDKQAITDEIQAFQNLGISGVPTFIYNGQFLVQGAQSVETHLKALEKAATLPLPKL